MTVSARDAPVDLVLVRHGESEWNAKRLATGWSDVGLTERGRVQAVAAGRLLAVEGVRTDVVYTSTLRRAHETARLLLDGWGHPAPPVHALWQLNERHLGQLQGLDKETIKRRWGNAQRQRWRSDPDALPPPLSADDPRHARHDRRFEDVPRQSLPAAERIRDLRRRVLACWHVLLAPQLALGRRVTVVAHRDSLRVLIAELEGIDVDRFAEIEVGPALPRTYSLRNHGIPVRS